MKRIIHTKRQTAEHALSAPATRSAPKTKSASKATKTSRAAKSIKTPPKRVVKKMTVQKEILPKKPRAQKKKEAAHEPAADVANEHTMMSKADAQTPVPAAEIFPHIATDVHMRAIAELPVRDDAHASVEQEVAKLIREVERTNKSEAEVFEPRTYHGSDVITSVRPQIVVPEAAIREAAEHEVEEPVKMPLIAMTYEEAMRVPASIAAVKSKTPLVLISTALLLTVALGGVGAVAIVVGIGKIVQFFTKTLAHFGDSITAYLQKIAVRQ